MNFEVHNINLKSRAHIRSSESITSLYVAHQGENFNAEGGTRKVTQLNTGASRQRKIKRRAYELPLL